METPTENIPIITNEKPEVKKLKKVIHENQRAALQKGMDALKLKREMIAKDKEQRKKEGLPPPEKEARVKHVQNYAPEKPVKIRKERTVYNTPKTIKESIFSDSEYIQLKELLNKEKNPVIEKTVVKEIPIEKIVHTEKVVHTERLLTGSELLNRIFF